LVIPKEEVNHQGYLTTYKLFGELVYKQRKVSILNSMLVNLYYSIY
jgi:hypothetical protein